MENNQKIYHINPAIIIAVIFQLIFIVFAGITIYNVLNRNDGTPKIKISDYSAIPDGEIIGKDNGTLKVQDIDFALDDTTKKTMENAIYDVASINNEGSIANHGAKIREGSAHYVYIEDLNGYFLHFIVDIEDLGQSYHFVRLFNNDSSDQKGPKIELLMAFCPRKNEMIYGDFDCKDNYNNHGEDLVVYFLLKDRFFDGFFINLFGDVLNGGALEKIYISPVVNNEDTRADAERTLREWLGNLGINLDNFYYEFSIYNWT